MIFYLRVILAFIWVFFSCVTWLLIAAFSWRNAKLFSPSVRFMAWGGLKALGLKTSISGAHYLKDLPAVMISNHQSFLDTLILGSIWPEKVVPIGKKEIGYLPLIGWWFVGCGARLIDRSQKESAKNILENQIPFILSGYGIGITPEGTRNKKGQGLLPFKKGAFNLAVKAQVPIIGLVVAPLGDIASWKERRLKKVTIPIRVLPPFPTKGLSESDVESLTNQIHRKVLETVNELGSEMKN